MFSPVPWKSDAVMRLLVSIFLCIFFGSLALALGHYVFSKGMPGTVPLVSGIAGMVCLVVTLFTVRSPWPDERFVQRLCLAGLFFYIGLFLGSWTMKMTGSPAHSVLSMITAAVSFQGAILALLPAFIREHNADWANAFGLRIQPGRALVAGVLLACIFLPFGWGLQWLATEVMQRIPGQTFQPAEQQSVQVLRDTAGWGYRFALALITIVLAPVGEELLFRGILYPWIKQIGYPRLALWASSVLFAAVHFNIASFLPLLVLSILLVTVYQRTENLLAPIIAHSVFNAFNFAAIYIFPYLKFSTR